MKVTYSYETRQILLEAESPAEYEALFQEIEVLKEEGPELFTKRDLGEPSLDIHKGDRLVLKWDAATFAGFGLAELDAGGPESFGPEAVANPAVNLEAVNAWWQANRAALVQRAKDTLDSIPRL